MGLPLFAYHETVPSEGISSQNMKDRMGPFFPNGDVLGISLLEFETLQNRVHTE